MSLALFPSSQRVQAQGLELAADTETIVRELAAGEEHGFQIVLDPRRQTLLEVEQHGIDIVVEASTAGGERLAVDAPAYRQGRETLLLPALASGRWSLVVRSASPAVGAGKYRLRITSLEGATSETLAAIEALTEVGQLNLLGSSADRRRAVSKLQEAMLLWRELGERSQEARALWSLGVLQIALGDYRPAVESYSAALPLLRQLDEQELEAVALNDLGLAFWRLGEDSKAQEVLEQALVLQKRLENRYGAAIVLNNLCLRMHTAGRLPDALGCYEQVLQLLLEQGELQYEGLVLSNLGSVYNNLGEPLLALEHHRQALNLRRISGDRAGEAQSLNNIAVVYRRGGQMQAALDHYQQALAVRRELGEIASQGPILSNIGYAYYSLGEPQRALTFLGQALKLRRQTGDRRGESITLNVLGQVRTALGEHDVAHQLFRQSLTLRKQIGDSQGAASTLNRMGRSLVAAGRPEEALETFDLALEALGDIEDRREAALALHSRGEAYLLLDAPEKALFGLARALRLRIGMSDPHGEIETLIVLAETQRRLSQTAAALENVEQATVKIESLRTRVSAPDLRATFLASQRRAYELQVELLMALHVGDPSAGFGERARQVGERARARSLLDVLSAAEADFDRALAPELRLRRGQLQQRLDAKANQRMTLLSRGRAAEEAQLELYQVVAELDSLEEEMRRSSPRYEALAHPRPLALAETQALLGEGTLLLEYLLGTERSFLWAVSRDTFAAHELPGREELKRLVERVASQLGTLDPRAVGAESEAARELSGLLLGPVAASLEERRVVIVADGVLHYLPFSTLPSPRKPGAVGRSLPMLVRHEIAHLPSASALGIQRKLVAGRRPASRWTAVLADPVFAVGDSRLADAMQRPPRLPTPEGTNRVALGNPGSSTIAEDRPLDSVTTGTAMGLATDRTKRVAPGGMVLDRLPLTRQEAEAIASLAGPGQVMLALGFDASREMVLAGGLQDFRVVHLATHGLIHAETPQLSGLVLSLFDRQGKPQEGFLRFSDIYSLDLDADLVVLSGCQTALGRDIAGEGLVGLTRGFMYAGVPRVVASLWRVEDRATAELMSRFYRMMSVEGLAPAAALRAAQLSISNERRWADPYYWGAFVLQGDWR